MKIVYQAEEVKGPMFGRLVMGMEVEVSENIARGLLATGKWIESKDYGKQQGDLINRLTGGKGGKASRPNKEVG